MKSELEKLMEDSDPIVKKAAEEVAVIQDGVKAGDLSTEHARELIEDILETKKIDDIADSLERKIYIIKSFETLKKIIGVMLK